MRDGLSDFGITGSINRESTSGRTIRKLPLTNRSSLGVLDNPHFGRMIKFFRLDGLLIFSIGIVYAAFSPRSAIESVKVPLIN